MFKFMMIAIILIGFPLTVLAEPSAQESIRTKDGRWFIVGIGSGFEWANADLNNKKQRPLYCPPHTVAIVGEQYISMLEQQLKKRPDLGGQPAGAVLLVALQEAFPCR